MTVHKIKIAGVSYRGVSGRDGVIVFTPPLPESYVEKCNSQLQQIIEERKFPGLNTDTTFLAGRGMLDQQIKDPIALETVIAGARADGYNPKPTDVYLSGVADKPGDRHAWLSAGDAKGHIRNICEQRNVGCYGSLNIPQPERRIDPDVARAKARERALARQAARARALSQSQQHRVAG